VPAALEPNGKVLLFPTQGLFGNLEASNSISATNTYAAVPFAVRRSDPRLHERMLVLPTAKSSFGRRSVLRVYRLEARRARGRPTVSSVVNNGGGS